MLARLYLTLAEQAQKNTISGVSYPDLQELTPPVSRRLLGALALSPAEFRKGAVLGGEVLSGWAKNRVG